MSKINQLQAAALNAPVVKSEPVSKAPATAKPATTKSVATKTVATKVVIAKATTIKPTAAKPVAAKPTTSASKTKAVKVVKEKAPKLKMERDSFTMPKAEYAQFYVLKDRLAKLGQPAKKSELLRAGIMQLTAMTDTALKAAMSKVPTIKTGRPKKK
ncbi:MAG: hypothetical protein ABL920_00930 [Methylotenera sp.]|nr:hypothetical protein [Methylotenera sp.]NOT65150.1 hypothetical protein [Methylotenera sp.]